MRACTGIPWGLSDKKFNCVRRSLVNEVDREQLDFLELVCRAKRRQTICKADHRMMSEVRSGIYAGLRKDSMDSLTRENAVHFLESKATKTFIYQL